MYFFFYLFVITKVIRKILILLLLFFNIFSFLYYFFFNSSTAYCVIHTYVCVCIDCIILAFLRHGTRVGQEEQNYCRNSINRPTNLIDSAIRFVGEYTNKHGISSIVTTNIPQLIYSAIIYIVPFFATSITISIHVY